MAVGMRKECTLVHWVNFKISARGKICISAFVHVLKPTVDKTEVLHHKFPGGQVCSILIYSSSQSKSKFAPVPCYLSFSKHICLSCVGHPQKLELSSHYTFKCECTWGRI